jgi:hypothetical protein
MKYLLLSISMVASISSVFASSTLESRAAKFFEMKALGMVEDHELPPTCQPMSKECIVFVAGSYPSTSDRIDAVRACVGNYGDACAKYVSGSYPSKSDRIESARACRNNYNLDCATLVSGSYPSHAERLESVLACANVDVECLKFILGSYPSRSERLEAAKVCSGLE